METISEFDIEITFTFTCVKCKKQSSEEVELRRAFVTDDDDYHVELHIYIFCEHCGEGHRVHFYDIRGNFMDRWAIVDEKGVVYDGTGEAIRAIFDRIKNGDIEALEPKGGFDGEIMLVQIHETYREH